MASATTRAAPALGLLHLLPGGRLLARILLAGGVLGVIDQGVVASGSFIANVVIARFTSVAEFGVYLLVVTAFSFLSDIQTSLITSPYMIVRPGLAPSERAAYRRGVVLQGLVALALAGGAALAAGAAAVISDRAGFSWWTAALLALCLGGMLLRDQIRRLRIADFDLAGATGLDLRVTTLMAVGLFGMAAMGWLTLSTALLAASVACIAPCLGWLRREWPEGAVGQFRHHAGVNWQHGRWLFLSALTWAAVSTAYPWILTYFHGVRQVGAWGAAFSALALCNVPMLGLQNYAGAHILNEGARGGMSRLRRRILGWSALFVGISLLFFAAYALEGERIVVLLYGAKYRGLGLLAALLALNIVATSANFCVSRGLFAIGRADLDLAVNTVPAAFLIAAGVWLTAAFGTTGAAVSLCASNALSLAARSVAFQWATRGGRSSVNED
jgi:O-antigen/teichoic acid export membrane protein